MTDKTDPLLEQLQSLGRITPRQAVIDRVRTRSHALLASQSQRRAAVARWSDRVAAAALFVIAGVYLAGALGQALMLQSVIRARF